MTMEELKEKQAAVVDTWLEKVTSRKKPFSEAEAATVMLDLMKALQHCHS